MNRLVIVGNGFDLAHGLPTGYCDFINNYWSKIQNSSYSDDLINFYIPEKLDFNSVTSFDDLKFQIARVKPGKTLRADDKGCYYDMIEVSNGTPYNYPDYVLRFNNSFFGIINTRHNIHYWVDIENEYYKLLKECLKEEDNVKVKKLNYEFEIVKKLLEKYLSEDVCNKMDFSHNNSEIKNIFNVWNRYTNSQNFSEEFAKAEQEEIIEYSQILKIYNTSGGRDISKFIITQNKEIQNLFLNFNYTPTIDSYISSLTNDDENYYGNSINLQIHGRLNDGGNRINFGFGDEMDNHYKLIEEKDDNEYLQNIKSFQYLQNSNYKRLLDFIESKKFQVYVMGHSCGLSDRILLNTIFEHENCKSIKVFYYESGNYNNYTEIIQNISRHFNKKKLMREKIVNKTLCHPLPQIKLPLKANGSQ